MSLRYTEPGDLIPYHIYSAYYRDVKQKNDLHSYTDKYFFIVYKKSRHNGKNGVWVLNDDGTLTHIEIHSKNKKGKIPPPLVKNIKLESEMTEKEINYFGENIAPTLEVVGDNDDPGVVFLKQYKFVQQVVDRMGKISIFTEVYKDLIDKNKSTSVKLTKPTIIPKIEINIYDIFMSLPISKDPSPNSLLKFYILYLQHYVFEIIHDFCIKKGLGLGKDQQKELGEFYINEYKKFIIKLINYLNNSTVTDINLKDYIYALFGYGTDQVTIENNRASFAKKINVPFKTSNKYNVTQIFETDAYKNLHGQLELQEITESILDMFGIPLTNILRKELLDDVIKKNQKKNIIGNIYIANDIIPKKSKCGALMELFSRIKDNIFNITSIADKYDAGNSNSVLLRHLNTTNYTSPLDVKEFIPGVDGTIFTIMEYNINHTITKISNFLDTTLTLQIQNNSFVPTIQELIETQNETQDLVDIDPGVTNSEIYKQATIKNVVKLINSKNEGYYALFKLLGDKAKRDFFYYFTKTVGSNDLCIFYANDILSSSIASITIPGSVIVGDSVLREDKFPQTAEYIAKRQESDNMEVSFGKKRLKKFKVDSDIIYLKSL